MLPPPNCASWRELFTPLPFIAILRGIKSYEVLAIAEALFDCGFRAIEVPLNSPDAWQSIGLLQRTFGQHALIGAGTITQATDLRQLRDCGATLAVMPHCDSSLIHLATELSLCAIPGVATPSEAFAALKAGAQALKVFPSNMVTPATLKAWRTVLPRDTMLLPVGGIDANNMAAYVQHGANGFGLGNALYKPGDDVARVRQNANALIDAWRQTECC